MNRISRPDFSTSSGGSDTPDSTAASGQVDSDMPSPRPSDGRANSGESTEAGVMQGDDMSEILVLSNLREAPEIADQPFAYPRKWRAIKVNHSEFRLALLINAGKTFRMTSRLVAMDPDRRRVRTESGRVYELEGLPSDDELLLSTLLIYAASHGFGSLEDASFEDLCRLKLEDSN